VLAKPLRFILESLCQGLNLIWVDLHLGAATDLLAELRPEVRRVLERCAFRGRCRPLAGRGAGLRTLVACHEVCPPSCTVRTPGRTDLVSGATVPHDADNLALVDRICYGVFRAYPICPTRIALSANPDTGHEASPCDQKAESKHKLFA
jgi:hypothetical protein